MALASLRPKNRSTSGFYILARQVLASRTASLLLGLSLASPARAETPPDAPSAEKSAAAPADAAPPTLSRAELLARLAQGEWRLAALDARLALARAEVLAAGRVPNPSLGLEREELFADGDGLPEHELRLSWPLELSGRRGLAVRVAEAELGAVIAEDSLARRELELEALTAYDQASLARSRLARAVARRDALATLREVVSRRVASGHAPTYDGTRLDLELAGWDDLIEASRAELEQARTRLATLAGHPGERRDALDPAALPTLPRRPTREAALAARPERAAAEQRQRAARLAMDRADRSWVPDLVLDGGLRTADRGPAGTAYGYVAGVSIELPFFDRAPGEHERAAAQRLEASSRLAWIERHAPAETDLAFTRLELAIARAETFRSRQLGPLEALLRAVDTAYREGGRPIFELVDAYRAARDLDLRELDLIADAMAARRELERRLGPLVTPTESP